MLNGRCLACNPQDPDKEELVAEVAAVPVSRKSARPRSGGSTTKGASMGTSMRVPASMRSSTVSARGTARRPRGFAQSMLPGSSLPPADADAHVDNDDDRRALSPSKRPSKQSNDPNHERGEPNQGEERPKTSSHKTDFLDKPTPRPSTVLLDGNNIADLFKDYDLDDQDGEDAKSDAPPINSAVARLTPEERQALQSLNSNDNSFLDIVTIMLMNSTSAPVNDEGLHALSLLRDPDVKLLEEVADSCGFEVIVSAMGKCSKVSFGQCLLPLTLL